MNLINFLSNHPTEHKTVTLRYHITRMHSLPLTTARKQKEWETIQQIAKTTISHNTYCTE
jgi:hypothetical protein